MWWNCHHCWGRVQVFHSRHLSCFQASLCQVSNSSCGPPWVVSFLFLSCLSFGQLWTLNGKPYASVWLFCAYYTWTWSRHIRQEHVRLFHHICSSWKFLLVIPEKHARGRSGSGFLWCLETAIALLARPFLHSAQFSRFLPGQGLLAGAVSALRFGKSNPDNLVSYHVLFQSAKVAGFYQLSKVRQVRIEQLVCLLCSRPEFVAFWYYVLFRGKVPIQSGLGLFEALVFARERVENALHCGAKTMQHHGSLNCIVLFL